MTILEFLFEVELTFPFSCKNVHVFVKRKALSAIFAIFVIIFRFTGRQYSVALEATFLLSLLDHVSRHFGGINDSVLHLDDSVLHDDDSVLRVDDSVLHDAKQMQN